MVVGYAADVGDQFECGDGFVDFVVVGEFGNVVVVVVEVDGGVVVVDVVVVDVGDVVGVGADVVGVVGCYVGEQCDVGVVEAGGEVRLAS